MPAMSRTAITSRAYGGMWLTRAGARRSSIAQTPGLAVRALMGTMNWTLTWYRPDGDLSITRIADEYADLFLNGLMKKSKE